MEPGSAVRSAPLTLALPLLHPAPALPGSGRTAGRPACPGPAPALPGLTGHSRLAGLDQTRARTPAVVGKRYA